MDSTFRSNICVFTEWLLTEPGRSMQSRGQLFLLIFLRKWRIMKVDEMEKCIDVVVLVWRLKHSPELCIRTASLLFTTLLLCLLTNATFAMRWFPSLSLSLQHREPFLVQDKKRWWQWEHFYDWKWQSGLFVEGMPRVLWFLSPEFYIMHAVLFNAFS